MSGFITLEVLYLNCQYGAHFNFEYKFLCKLSINVQKSTWYRTDLFPCSYSVCQTPW